MDDGEVESSDSGAFDGSYGLVFDSVTVYKCLGRTPMDLGLTSNASCVMLLAPGEAVMFIPHLGGSWVVSAGPLTHSSFAEAVGQ